MIGDRLRRFGTPADPALAARVEVRDRRAYRSVALGGAIGAAEAYARGWWEASDLTALIRIVARNLEAAAGIDGWTTRAAMAAHRLRHGCARTGGAGAAATSRPTTTSGTRSSRRSSTRR